MSSSTTHHLGKKRGNQINECKCAENNIAIILCTPQHISSCSFSYNGLLLTRLIAFSITFKRATHHSPITQKLPMLTMFTLPVDFVFKKIQIKHESHVSTHGRESKHILLCADITLHPPSEIVFTTEIKPEW